MRICSLGKKQVCVVCINGCSYLEKMYGIFQGQGKLAVTGADLGEGEGAKGSHPPSLR